MKFGPTFAEVRKKYSFSQGDVGKILSICSTYISDVETGRKIPFPLPTLQKIIDCIQPTQTERHRLFQLATTERKTLAVPVSSREEEQNFICHLGKMITEAEPIGGLPTELFDELSEVLQKYEVHLQKYEDQKTSSL